MAPYRKVDYLIRLGSDSVLRLLNKLKFVSFRALSILTFIHSNFIKDSIDMSKKASSIPDAWDDDWEVQADVHT